MYRYEFSRPDLSSLKKSNNQPSRGRPLSRYKANDQDVESSGSYHGVQIITLQPMSDQQTQSTSNLTPGRREEKVF